MLDCAAVNVSLLWDELQSGRLSEGTVCVGEGNVDAGSFSHVLSVLGPVDLYRSRIETSHMTDQLVLLSELHVVSGVDEQAGRRIWTETQILVISHMISLCPACLDFRVSLCLQV